MRADALPSQETLDELNRLRKENHTLREAVRNASPPPSIPDLASLDDTVEISGTSVRYAGEAKRSWRHTFTWGEVFAAIAPYLLENPSDFLVNLRLKQVCLRTAKLDPYSSEIDDQVFQTVKIQLLALGLVNVHYAETTTKTMALFWQLTDLGTRTLINLRAVRKGA